MSGSKPGGYRSPSGSSRQIIVEPSPDITHQEFALTQNCKFSSGDTEGKLTVHDYDAIARHKKNN